MIAERLREVRAQIAAASARAGRSPDDVTLLAVSKRHSVESIEAAYAAGQRAFGENYAQELVEKAAALEGRADLGWHFIGQLQRNKARALTPIANLTVQTLDSIRLARELDKRAEAALDVFVQVNVAAEPQKGGCALAELDAVLDAVGASEHLRARGLMTIPPAVDDPEDSRRWFAALRELASARGLRELSMGMSADLEIAIEEGATLVRVGTAIFGAR